MIRITITAATFDAIAAMLASGNVLYDRERTAQGGYLVWLDESVVNNLGKAAGAARRGPQRRHRPALRRAMWPERWS
jgi:hypothetical protein